MADADRPLVEAMLLGGAVVPYSARFRGKLMTLFPLLLGLISAVLLSRGQGWQGLTVLKPVMLMDMKPMRTLRPVQETRVWQHMHSPMPSQFMQPIHGRQPNLQIRASPFETESPFAKKPSETEPKTEGEVKAPVSDNKVNAPPSYFNVRQNFEADQAMMKEIEGIFREKSDAKTAKKNTEKILSGDIDPFSPSAASAGSSGGADPFYPGMTGDYFENLKQSEAGLETTMRTDGLLPEPKQLYESVSSIELPDFKDVPWILVFSFSTLSLGTMYAVKLVYDLGAIRIG